MHDRSRLRLLLAGLLAAASLAAAAQPTQDRTQLREEQRIYGSQLMTQQERLEYQRRLRELKTVEAREQFRKEHHEAMQVRAKERGVKLPDEPPARGMGGGPRLGNDRPGGGPGRP
jgi:hypothetical protein